MKPISLPILDVEEAVRRRYSSASQEKAPELCCPVSYNPKFLEILPQELIERDYGCGDPSQAVSPGETVLDLGSGGGKICYIAAQAVGPAGFVIGVDMNDDMLALARKYQGEIASKLGYDNVSFRKGRIQDLKLDIDRFEAYLQASPIHNSRDWIAAEGHARRLGETAPLIADNSIDVVVSNCVLNLVQPRDREQLFAELFRVLKPGGRAVISDITSDMPVPETLQRDETLWSGCISGAFVEQDFPLAFERAGFMGIEIVERQAQPWMTVQGIEFRSVTIRAYKPPAETVNGGKQLGASSHKAEETFNLLEQPKGCCPPGKCC